MSLNSDPNSGTMQQLKRCDLRGTIGKAPSEKDFCFFMRAFRLSNHLRCEAKFVESGIDESLSHTCQSDASNWNDKMIPIFWKVEDGMVHKGSYCAFTGDWYWKLEASCESDQSSVEANDKDDNGDLIEPSLRDSLENEGHHEAMLGMNQQEKFDQDHGENHPKEEHSTNFK